MQHDVGQPVATALPHFVPFLVNGKVLIDHDELTEERPSHVVTPS